MYDFRISKACKKDLKKMDPQIVRFIRFKIFPKILKNPKIGSGLKGSKYDFLLKYAFKHKRSDYRIIYYTKEDKLILVFVMVGGRENFYDKLGKRL